MARRLIDRIDELDPLRRPGAISALPDISGDFGLVDDISTPSIDNFVSFPFEDVFFEGGVVDRDSQRTLGSLNRLKVIGRSGRATGDEVFEKAKPLITQLDNTRRRRRARDGVVQQREFLVAKVADTAVFAEDAKVALAEANAKRDALEDKLTNLEQSENANPVAITSQRRELAQLDSSLPALETNAAETAAVATQARSEQLDSLAPVGDIHAEFAATSARLKAARTPEEQAEFEALRAGVTGDPLGEISDEDRAILGLPPREPPIPPAGIDDRITDRFEAELAEIAAKARTRAGTQRAGDIVKAKREAILDRLAEASDIGEIALLRRQLDELAEPAAPSEADKRSIRREIDPKIKAAKPHAEKKELAAEMRARLKGETTPLMDAKAKIAAFNRFEAAGVDQSPELLKIDAEINKALNSRLDRIKREMPNAQGQKAKALQREFEKVTAKIMKNLVAQADVLEERETAKAAKDKKRIDIAEKSLALSEERLTFAKEQAEKSRQAGEEKAIDAHLKAVRDAEATVKAAKLKADAMVKAAAKGKIKAGGQAVRAASLKTLDFKIGDLDTEITKEQARVAKLQLEIPELMRRREKLIDSKTGKVAADPKDHKGVSFAVLHEQLVKQIADAEEEWIQRRGRLGGFLGTPEAPGNIPGLLEKRDTLRKEREVIQSGQESTLEQKAWAKSWRAANPEKSKGDFWIAFKDQFGFLPEGAG